MAELLFRDDAYARACDATVTAVDERGIRLDRTVFSPLGGGQPGDSGSFRLPDGTALAIVDALRDGEDDVVHVPAPGVALPAVGTRLRAEIDWERRHRHMRFHTCLHLLCAVVPYPVTGGRIGTDKAHLDFDLQGAVLDKAGIEAKLNALVAAGHAPRPRWVSAAELDASPTLVKTMSVAPPRGAGRVRLVEIPGVDLQACGGTHVASTAEIGPVAVVKIRSEGKRNKRVVVAFAGEDVGA
ncbi:MAG: alanyl-tRNA editing protein [Burkholderiales bacterium]|nr:alanyl-tRNA editing protein [Burkholderiales bacterium]